jgi:hypothetical protein
MAWLPLIVVLPIGSRPTDVSRLGSLVAAAQKQDDLPARLSVVDAIAGAMVYPEFPNALSDGLVIAETAGL